MPSFLSRFPLLPDGLIEITGFFLEPKYQNQQQAAGF
jgi:hypothetical protein